MQEIVTAAEITTGDTVLEIGPGTGTLTDELLATQAKIIAVEKDDLLASDLGMKYGERARVINQDILTYAPDFKEYKIIGNLPYYLTSHLIRTILTSWPRPKLMVFMVQKEVAQRMAAKPPQMNMLAVLTQLYSTPKIIKIVKPGNFNPPPKVDSAIIQLIPHAQAPENPQKLLDTAAKGFLNPRKMLGNKLPKDLLQQAGLDPARRAETISLQEWKTLANLVV